MTTLSVYDANNPNQCQATFTDFEQIAAYQASIDTLAAENNFRSVDVVNLYPEHPDKQILREKFLAEHVHADDEVRFFIDGSGLFYIHLDDKVYGVLCEKNNLINVPAGIKHWFDTGAEPFFKCIGMFTQNDGWVATFTGDEIAKQFSLMEA